MPHSYGWIKDKPDERDFIYHAGQDVKEPLPKTPIGYFFEWLVNLFHPKPKPQPSDNKKVDLRSDDSPIEDQGQLGSCTANALAGALQFLEVKDSLPDQAFSRLFVYYNERVIEGTTSSDSGAEIRDGIKTLASQGSCYETTWPYDINQFAVQPPQAAYVEASNHEIVQYFKITSLADMKACLDAGYPFVYGFTVYASFESPSADSTGIIPMPSGLEPVLGGHAVMCLGYDDEKQWFICRNSWGTGWGDHGYFYIPFDYLADAQLASDFWTIRRGTNMVAKPSTA